MNPLNKRFKRELKSDVGKYAAIFLFLTFFISAMSGFFLTNHSITANYQESHTLYNIEDGHISFNIEPTKEVCDKIEAQNQLTLYRLYYKDETVKERNNTLRIYQDRENVNLECIMNGVMPQSDNEIAIDRLYAENNTIKIGERITIRDAQYTVTGFIALPDYSTLFESNADMMFDAINFGVAVMSEAGFNKISTAHLIYNYAYQYNTKITDNKDANTRSESLTDSLEKIIKEYDEPLIQAQVDRIYNDAKSIINSLTNEFETASDVMETKIRAAMRKAGMLNTTGIVKELGTTEEKYQAMMDAFKEAETLKDDFDFKTLNKAPKINLDNYRNEVGFDSKLQNGMDMLYKIVGAVEDTDIYDCRSIRKNLDTLNSMMRVDIDESGILTVEDYNPKYTNKSIQFVNEDSASDKAFATLMVNIIIAVIAFVFAVTSSNTIAKDAAVIGTLRASGYSRGALTRHYTFLPITVTLVASLIGNILGYTLFPKIYCDVLFGNYSLTTYKNVFNSDAFVRTTIVPFILMLVINFLVLHAKLKISPLNFLRGELKKRSRQSVLRLPNKLPLFSKFRLRILFQNIPSYGTLLAGIIMAGTLVVFSTMMVPLTEDYTARVNETKIARYQYILKDQSKTEHTGAEAYCVTSLDTMYNDYLTDSVGIYGIQKNSRYVTADIPDGKVLLSNGMMDKYSLKIGDSVDLKEPYGNKIYSFDIAGEYPYDAAVSVFMNRSDYLKMFNKGDDYFTGYFSNEELEDINEDSIATVITEADLIKMVTQLKSSLLGFMIVFEWLGVILFALIMFILTKQIIEKNRQSIAMTKILGFNDFEIGKLYLVITSFVVLASLLAAIPIVNALLDWAFHSYLYKRMTGYIPYEPNFVSYLKMIVLGMASYAVVSGGMIFKIKRMPKGEALKNQFF